METATQSDYSDGSLVKFPKANFYPRIDLAYKLTADGKTAIRGGYGSYTQQWNLTFEKQIHRIGISIAYIGVHSVALLYSRNLNQAYCDRQSV